MATETAQSIWENLVKKQLKTEDIDAVLSKENLENIVVKPFYTKTRNAMVNLPKIEESTHLVAQYQENDSDEIYAFLLNENVEGLEDKTLFINTKELAEHLILDENNRYFSLIDVFFEDKETKIDLQLAQLLLSKTFVRNICVDVSFHQNCGASIIQQIAIALAKTKELVEEFSVEILDKILFKFSLGSNYFFEIAKIRAFKHAFNQFSKEYDLDLIPYIFAETSFRNKSKNDAENNLIRATLELSAAMIGGADAVFSNNYTIEKEDELSNEISFKQQIVLAYESIINVFDDAGNGSYFVEEISHQFASKSWQYFVEIEEKGGYLKAIQSGEIQEKIYQHAISEQNWVEEGKIKLIGVNFYPKLAKTKSAEELYDVHEIKPVRWAEMYE